MPTNPRVALARLRAEIDDIDEQLVMLLARRFDLTDDVGRWKARIREPALNPDRQRRRSRLLTALARRHGLPKQFVLDLFGRLKTEVVARHESVAAHAATGS
jgi:chorismate mutase